MIAPAGAPVNLLAAMNPPDEPTPRSSSISAEALVGIGMTLTWLGLLGILLGWAEWLRKVPSVAVIWLSLGAVMMIVGAITAVAGRRKKR
ncbi:MAG: hypothetical protein ACR2HH_03475 [Chthoniobacterales bacterium]